MSDPSLFLPDPPPAGEVRMLQGHSLDLIDTVPTFDLLATDPPYAIGGEGQEHAVGAVVACVLREAGKRLAPGGWAVVYAASSWRSTFYMVESLKNVLTPVRTATWVKPTAKTKVNGSGWAWASVNVIVFRKPGGDKTIKYRSPMLDWIEAEPLKVGRRAQLPPRVAEWSIAPFATPGLTMLDPFAGSGALLNAAAAAGMSAIGFEQDPISEPEEAA